MPLNIHHYNWSWTEPIYSYKARWSTATPTAMARQTNKWGEETPPEIRLSLENTTVVFLQCKWSPWQNSPSLYPHCMCHYHNLWSLQQPRQWWSRAVTTYSQRWGDYWGIPTWTWHLEGVNVSQSAWIEVIKQRLNVKSRLLTNCIDTLANGFINFPDL